MIWFRKVMTPARNATCKQKRATDPHQKWVGGIFFSSSALHIRGFRSDLRCLPHTARNAARRQAKRRKSTAFIEKLHICMETGIEKFALCMVQSYWKIISNFWTTEGGFNMNKLIVLTKTTMKKLTSLVCVALLLLSVSLLGACTFNSTRGDVKMQFMRDFNLDIDKD